MKQMMVVQKSSAEALAAEIEGRLRKLGVKIVHNPAQCDAIIAVGGDGTILNAAHMVLPHGKPVLGVNAGRLGFLAGLEQHELDTLLPRLAAGDFALDYRMLLHVQVEQHGQIIRDSLCVNDAVLARRFPRIAEINVICDDGQTLSYLGDGVIFATPTGSTAYNFSAGGPVVQPGIESILLTPICNHKAPARTIVFAADSTFSVEIPDEELALGIDAQAPQPLHRGSRVTVRRHSSQAAFIRLKPASFLEIFNEKMGVSL